MINLENNNLDCFVSDPENFDIELYSVEKVRSV